MRSLLKRAIENYWGPIISAAIAIAVTATITAALAALDRTVPVGTGDLTDVVTDLNEELTQIYSQLPQPLDTVSGTNNYTASIAGMPPLTALVAGNKFTIKIPNSNTSTTINLDVDSIGNTAVVSRAGGAIPVGGLAANTVYLFEYFGGGDNHYRVMSSLATSGESVQDICASAGDETTAITTGTAKVTFNVPRAITLTGIFAYVKTASTTGAMTVDVHEDPDREGGGASTTLMTTTKITIDQNERSSSSAAIAPVLTDTSLAAHSELRVDVDAVVGTPVGLKVCLTGSAT